ncbi:MAG: ribosome assembly factor SBDS [Thermoplasma acidophilum]|nr:ribosome assembly factor SBDS [Thermoplasma acidophilum]
MVKVEDAIVARLESHGYHFEILVDPDAIERIRKGNIDIENDLAFPEVYKDVRKGEKASEESLKEAFKTTDIAQVAIEIVKKGQIQLTTEQRREMYDERRKQIVNLIAREGINPQTNTPHTPYRISQAMDEAKVKIDPFKPAEDQVQNVLKAIMPIIPIRLEKAKIAVKLIGDAYGKLYGELAKSGYIVKEEWGKDGSWMGILEVPAGIQGDIIENLSRRGGDKVQIKILKQ